MNPNTMTIEAIRDELARRDGWYINSRGYWERPIDGDQSEHPIPATLDEAARLPGEWNLDTMERNEGGTHFVHAWQSGTCKTQSSMADTELLARFRLRLACTLADEGSKT